MYERAICKMTLKGDNFKSFLRCLVLLSMADVHSDKSGNKFGLRRERQLIEGSADLLAMTWHLSGVDLRVETSLFSNPILGCKEHQLMRTRWKSLAFLQHLEHVRTLVTK